LTENVGEESLSNYLKPEEFMNPRFCHSRESGNPFRNRILPWHVDARVRGHDISESVARITVHELSRQDPFPARRGMA
jgi:hypothetical protein